MALRITTKFQTISFRRKRYAKAIDKRVDEIIHRAAIEWVNTAITVVPLWSGASRATFRILVPNLPISPVVKSRVALGESKSEGGIEESRGGVGSFEYRSDLKHLVFNESNNANSEFGFNLKKPGPYFFLKATEELVSQFIAGQSFSPVTDHIKLNPLRR